MTTDTRRDTVREAFEAAEDYDKHATIQRTVARELAEGLGALHLPDEPKILEIGCGTGFLVDAMMQFGIYGDYLVTDVAPAMVERARAKVGEGTDIRYAVLDAEYDTPEGGPFDLICSNLALQWFDDPKAAIGRMLGWLAPGGHLVATILTSGTFAEWRAACEAEGVDCGVPKFPDPAELGDWYRDKWGTPPKGHHYRMIYGNGTRFLEMLRGLGANTPAEGYQPMKPAELRRVIERFEKPTPKATFDVVTLHFALPLQD